MPSTFLALMGMEVFEHVLAASNVTPKRWTGSRRVAILEDQDLLKLISLCKDARRLITGRAASGEHVGCSVDGFWRRKLEGLLGSGLDTSLLSMDIEEGLVTWNGKSTLLDVLGLVDLPVLRRDRGLR